jgi:hypothetical protein
MIVCMLHGVFSMDISCLLQLDQLSDKSLSPSECLFLKTRAFLLRPHPS